MEDTVLAVHGFVRYLVLVAGLGAVVLALLGLRRRAGDERTERLALTVFVGLVDVQVLLGVVLLALRPFYGQLMGHIVTMVIAAAVAHIGSARAKKRIAAGEPAARVRLITALVTLVLIVAGIAAIGRPIV